MNLTEKIEQVADRVKDQKDFIGGGASTKSTFVVPFIEALGYDTYDPNEVTPDFSVEGREGDRETVDYALLPMRGELRKRDAPSSSENALAERG